MTIYLMLLLVSLPLDCPKSGYIPSNDFLVFPAPGLINPFTPSLSCTGGGTGVKVDATLDGDKADESLSRGWRVFRVTVKGGDIEIKERVRTAEPVRYRVEEKEVGGGE